MRTIFTFLYLCIAADVYAGEQQLHATHSSLDLSFETLTLDEFQGEKMGLLGGRLLYALENHPWLSLGPAAYGTLTGERGGFITLGLAGGAHLPLTEQLQGDAGIFIGAGGGHGGYQLQGGGLMLRPHLGISYDGGFGDVGLGVSQVSFPNGHVDSSQLYLSYSYDFEMLLADGWIKTNKAASGETWAFENKHRFGVVYRQYDVPAGVKNGAGGKQYPTIGLVGVEWQQQLDERYFISIESEGAMVGKSNGFMQILLGGGMRYPLSDAWEVKLSASAGVAGGGNVDTGGGLLADLAVGLQTDIGDSLSAEFEVAWTDSLVSEFKARSMALKLSQRFATPDVSMHKYVTLDQLSGYSAEHMRLRFVNQSYFALPANASSWRVHHADRDVNNLGFQGDYFLTDNLYLSGQGIAAYEGQAGGYMTGLLGVGLSYPVWNGWSAEAELLAGAAGGGGLAVGGGLVWQLNAGLSYHLSEDYSALMMAGRVDAPKGAFAANVFSVALAYNFSLFMK